MSNFLEGSDPTIKIFKNPDGKYNISVSAPTNTGAIANAIGDTFGASGEWRVSCARAFARPDYAYSAFINEQPNQFGNNDLNSTVYPLQMILPRECVPLQDLNGMQEIAVESQALVSANIAPEVTVQEAAQSEFNPWLLGGLCCGLPLLVGVAGMVGLFRHGMKLANKSSNHLPDSSVPDMALGSYIGSDSEESPVQVNISVGEPLAAHIAHASPNFAAMAIGRDLGNAVRAGYITQEQAEIAAQEAGDILGLASKPGDAKAVYEGVHSQVVQAAGRAVKS